MNHDTDTPTAAVRLAEPMKPEPYIPLSVTDLIDVLLTEAGTPERPPLPHDQHEAFLTLADAMIQRVETGYRSLFKLLKDAYAPFDPDSETYRLRDLGIDGFRGRLDRLFTSFTVLLERGGFHRMTREEIEITMQGASYWGIEMDVCWDVFERVEIFHRGHGMTWRTRYPWWKLFRLQEVELPTFRRVVVILKQQAHPRLGPHPDTNSVFLKVFKDIPSMDVEMLLPGTRLRMPRFERGKLGGTILSSIAYVGWKIVTSVSIPALLQGSLLALATPLLLILGYGYKTIYQYRVSKRSYLLQLTQSLYYQSLDSNAGVMHRLFDEAAEQDIRQTLLTYYFLWRFAGPGGWTIDELDREVEQDLLRRVRRTIEVDSDDAVQRLERFGVIRRSGDRFIALPIAAATAELKRGPSTDEQSEWRSMTGTA